MGRAAACKRRSLASSGVAVVGAALVLGACFGIPGLTDDEAASCGKGKADCDGNDGNGCETKLTTDPQHCGKCGNACINVPGALAVCANGVCGLSCTGEIRDCDGDPSNGCETNVTQSPEHCGACGVECKADHAVIGQCAKGKCAFTCDVGFGDCDGDPKNGCEADLMKDLDHCGTCASVCSKSDAGVQIPCTGGQCRLLASCKELVGSGASSGEYTLAPAIGTPYQAYCSMDVDGGGWTLLLKVDGKQKTFQWGSALWSNASTLNEASPSPPPGNDHSKFVEAKIAGYASLAFTELRFETWDPRDPKIRALKLGKSSSSLLSAVQSGGGTSVSKNDWLSLLAKPLYYQEICNVQGFSRQVAGQVVRLGLIMNEPHPTETDACQSPDTAVGVGLGAYGISCGNYASGQLDKVIPAMPSSPQVLPAFCYLYVR